MGAGKTGIGGKCKRSMRLSESWEKTPKSVWWKDEIKAAVRRKEAAWKGVLAASDEETKEGCMEAYREDKRKVERCIIQSEKKIGSKIYEDVNGNRKLEELRLR